MNNTYWDKMHFETRAIHAGYDSALSQNAMVPPIYQTAAFRFKDIEDARTLYAGEREGFAYCRRGNPTTLTLEQKLAALEGGEACLAMTSGMAAIGATMLSLVKAGDHVITGKVLYGGTDYMMRNNLPELGVETTFVDTRDLENIRKAIRPNTKVIYFETPANPTMEITDIAGVAEIAKPLGIRIVVDNTYAPPPVQYPLSLGADYTVYSASKYLNGHGDVVAGAVISSKENIERIRMHVLMRISGGCIAPMQSYLVLRGLKTLDLRIRRHCESAMKVAQFLEQHPYIEKVYYPGLESDPQHALAKRQMQDGLYTGMIAFEMKEGAGGKTALEACKSLLNNLKVISLAVSLGDPDSLIQHPASMTHCNIPKEVRIASGVTDGLIRLSVGLEHPDDIINDLASGLKNI